MFDELALMLTAGFNRPPDDNRVGKVIDPQPVFQGRLDERLVVDQKNRTITMDWCEYIRWIDVAVNPSDAFRVVQAGLSCGWTPLKQSVRGCTFVVCTCVAHRTKQSFLSSIATGKCTLQKRNVGPYLGPAIRVKLRSGLDQRAAVAFCRVNDLLITVRCRKIVEQ